MDIHVVRAGETVSSVAARYGVPAGILAGVNGVAPDAPLAVGQTLVVRHPRELHTVASGESVYSIALRYGLSVRTLYQNNPALGGRSALYPGQTLVIAYNDTPTRTLAVNAYSYPFIRGGLLDAALPYLTYLTPFTYGINADGTLLPLADEWLLAAAGQYRTAALMHLSTLTEEGHFDNARSTLILEGADAQDALVQSILETVQARHYFGLDVDFEYVLPEQREAYAAFITRLREALNPLGCPVVVALAPKTSAAQRGLLYEAHDYALLGAAANAVFLMTYEWGYAYGPPMAVAPLGQVRAVLDYALTAVAPERSSWASRSTATTGPCPSYPARRGRNPSRRCRRSSALCATTLPFNTTPPRRPPITTTPTTAGASTLSGSRMRAASRPSSASRTNTICRAWGTGILHVPFPRTGRCSPRSLISRRFSKRASRWPLPPRLPHPAPSRRKGACRPRS